MGPVAYLVLVCLIYFPLLPYKVKAIPVSQVRKSEDRGLTNLTIEPEFISRSDYTSSFFLWRLASHESTSLDFTAVNQSALGSTNINSHGIENLSAVRVVMS